MESKIIVCDRRFDVGHPVVTYQDHGGFDARLEHCTNGAGRFPTHPVPGLEGRAKRYRARRFLRGRMDVQRLRQHVRQVVVHFDGCGTAKTCFDVLHNQRGLSVHFMVESDGTIYQTLDLAYCAYHAANANEHSVGIELQNKGDAAKFPRFYKKHRPKVTCRVHGVQFLAYDFTKEQYAAMARLCGRLAQILDVPVRSPESSGALVWTVLDDASQFRGFLGHYHISRNKWDPGPWDFRRLFRAMESRLTFPLTKPSARHESLTRTAYEAEGAQYFERSEKRGLAYFPVGPLGRSRLWHGGIHLAAKSADPVYAPMKGTVVAARMGPSCPIGSCNFVLLKHHIAAPNGRRAFFSLYYHLQRVTNGWRRKRPTWLRGQSDLANRLARGRVVLTETPVQAGDLIGHVGEAGPTNHRSPQIHFAIFAKKHIGAELDPKYWELVEGKVDQRFCKNDALLRAIDRRFEGEHRGDGLLSAPELQHFFTRNSGRTRFHRLAIRYLSEWTRGNWTKALIESEEFRELQENERDRLVREQITPTLWWTYDVADHAGLPRDGYVYAYHPIGFLIWMDGLLRKNEKLRPAWLGNEASWQGQAAPSRFTLDTDSIDSAGEDMIGAEDLVLGGPPGRRLGLEDLIRGYPD